MCTFPPSYDWTNFRKTLQRFLRLIRHRLLRSGNSFILNLAGSLRCQDATKSVNDVAIVAIDYVAIGRLHFQTIARCPGAAAQHSPITIGCAAAAFIGVDAPFPNVSAEIVQAYRIRLETADWDRGGAAPSRG